MRLIGPVILMGAVLGLAGCTPSAPIKQSAPIKKPENVTIEIDKDGNVYWYGKFVYCGDLTAKINGRVPDPANADRCEELARTPNDARP